MALLDLQQSLERVIPQLQEAASVAHGANLAVMVRLVLQLAKAQKTLAGLLDRLKVQKAQNDDHRPDVDRPDP